MGNTDSRAKFQQCLARLSDPAQELSLTEEAVMDQLCQDPAVSSVSEVFALITNSTFIIDNNLYYRSS